MIRLLRLFLLLSGLAVWLSGCENCGPSAEPNLQLTITATQPFQLDTIYGMGSSGKLPYFRQSGTTAIHSASIPLSLNADSSCYIARIDGRDETITVFYSRQFTYRSRTCGYVVDLKSPATTNRVRISRGRVMSMEYFQSSYSYRGLETGIALTISL